MAKGDDLPRRRFRGSSPAKPEQRRRDLRIKGSEQMAQAMEIVQAMGAKPDETVGRPADDVIPSDELVADAGLREREIQLIGELEEARSGEAVFEERYGMTFDEFQARFDPETDADSTEDYLTWSAAAERVRMLRYELERLAQKLPPRSHRPASAPDGPGKPDKAGPPVS